MATPCEKYQYLVVGPDGQTVDNPYGMVPTLGDLEEWKAVVRRILSLIEAELSKTVKLGAVTAEIGTRYEALKLREAELPSAWTIFSPDLTYGPAILEAVQLAQDAACLLGDVEAELEALGGKPAPKPKPGKKPEGNGLLSGLGSGLGVVLALGVLFVLAGKDD